MPTTIDTKQIAREITERIRQNNSSLKKFFAAVLVGDNPASVSFLKQKNKAAEEVGVDFRLYSFPTDITTDTLREEIGKIAKHATCGGILVQLPLPTHLNTHYILNAIPREKDVDVMGERALGAFYTGRNTVLPPAAATLEEIFTKISYSLEDKKVAVVGLGFLVGKPIAHYFMGKVSELHLLDKGADFGVLKEMDLVVSGVGKAGIIKPYMLKEGAGLIDFGYDITSQLKEDGSPKITLAGDLDQNLHEDTREHLAFYVSPPLGPGPILVSKLFENFYALNKKRE